MSLGALLFVLVAAWCTIHASYYFSKRRNAFLLPVHGTIRPESFLGAQITLNGLHLRVSTTRWNAQHDKLGTFFARRRNQKMTARLTTVYNFGVLLGALGMIFVMMFCLTGIWRALGETLAFDGRRVPASNLFKRIIEDTDDYQPYARGRFPNITPIIPGVTVPLNHLSIILVAVFIGQLIHELGHVAAAAVEALPMTTAGASFTVCIPAAFVTFSASGTSSLKRQARTRVIAAGPFHNFVFWCLSALFIHLGVVNLSLLISGYRNVSASGKAIVDVRADSPLFFHLTPGSLVTQLDDISLSSSMSRQDEWVNYLTSAERSPSFGWCVNRNAFVTSDPCCDAPLPSKNSSLTCFVSHDNVSERQGCIDPTSVFAIPSHERCMATVECATDSICVSPHRNLQLLRLKVRAEAIDDHETLVLWSGPRREIFEEVQVSDWLPRFHFLPLHAPAVLQNFWEYLSMATLSLYLFNLLPLPYLDGTELLKELIDMVFEDRGGEIAYDIESVQHRIDGPNHRGIWNKRAMRLVQSTLAMILTVYAVLALINVRH